MSHHHRRSTDMAFIMDAYGQQPSTSVSFMAEDDTWGSDRDTSSHTLLPPTSSQATDSYIFNATKNVPALDPLTRSLPSQRASNERQYQPGITVRQVTSQLSMTHSPT